MLTLVLEGFAGRNCRADHIARTRHQLEFPEAFIGRLAHRPLVEDADRFLGLEVVEKRHLAAADHRDLAHLSRIQPAGADVGDHAVAEAKRGEGHVLAARREERGALGRNPRRRLIEKVQEDGHVVGHQIPDDVHVGADGTKIRPGEGQILELSEGAGADHLLQMIDPRVVAKDVSNHEQALHPAGEVPQLACLVDVGRERLLDQAVLAGLERGAGHLVVAAGVGGDDDRIDVTGREQFANVCAGAQPR